MLHGCKQFQPTVYNIYTSACKLCACTNMQINDIELCACMGAKCIYVVYKYYVEISYGMLCMHTDFHKGSLEIFAIFM